MNGIMLLDDKFLSRSKRATNSTNLGRNEDGSTSDVSKKKRMFVLQMIQL